MADHAPPFKSANGSITSELDPSESCALAVVHAVAAVSDREPTMMSPLYDIVDTDALDALVADRGDFGYESDVRISFEYERHEVTVTRGGKISVKPIREVH